MEKQQESKLKKQNLLRKWKMVVVQEEYTRPLTYVEMAHSEAFWCTKVQAKRAFDKLSSTTVKHNAVKEQISIHVIRFGWKGLNYPWSKNGVEYLPEHLFDHLMNIKE
jgi:hypothetical protein